jgi:hypothetical protein
MRLMLNALAVVKQLFWQSQTVLGLNIKIILLCRRRLLRALLSVLDLCQCLFSRGLIYLFLLLLCILSGVGDFSDLYLSLVVIDSLDYLVVSNLSRVIRWQWVYAVVAAQVFQLILLSGTLLLTELAGECIYLFFKCLLLQEPLVLHVMHMLNNSALLLHAHAQEFQSVEEKLLFD